MDNSKSSLKMNAFMNTLLSVLSTVFPLITYPYVMRVLSPEGIGRVSFASSIVTYFVLFAQLGIPIYGIKVCAKVQDDREKLSRTSQELTILSLIMGSIAYIALIASIILIQKFQAEKKLLLISSLSIMINAIGFEWLYKALERYTYITVRSAVIKVISLVMMFTLVKDKDDYLIYAFITMFAGSASYLLNFINVHKHISLKPCGNYNFKQHLSPIGVFFGLASISTININLGTVLLGFLSSNAEVGFYNPPLKIKYVLVNLVSSLGVVLLPRAAYYIENDMTDNFLRISKKAADFVIVTSVPIGVYFVLYAEETILVLSGKGYMNSIPTLQLLMPILLLDGLINVMGIQMLVPMNKENKVLLSMITGIIVDLVISVLLIPSMGAEGAALGLLISEIIIFIVQFMFLRKYSIQVYVGQKYATVFGGVVFATIISVWLKSVQLHPFLILILSAALFFSAYSLFLLWRKEPIALDIMNMVLRKLRRE